MPKIKIEKVVSFSSEDSIHVANNILSNDPSKKWKCHTPGERSANLVLQLEEASVISSIDIGNEHSAYVEVLVNRSGSNDDFTVLLVMSSFMSPLEARQSTNINKVRMFTNEQLSQPEKNEKWDRVKIVCTQPFNKHVNYGLSFITFHTVGKDLTPQVPHIGKFALRPKSPDNISIGSLFARKKELQDNKPLTAAAAIRNASLSPQQSPLSSKKIKLPQTPVTSTDVNIDVANVSRKRDEIFYSKDEEEPNEKIDFFVQQKKEEKEKLDVTQISDAKKADTTERIKTQKNVTSDRSDKIKNKDDAKKEDTTTERIKTQKNVTSDRSDNIKNKDRVESSKPSSSKDRGESSKRKLNSLQDKPSKKIKNQPSKPFRELLNNVVIVISGIQNPDRANIRNMGLAMGAKYKGDWDNTCTHLICAFPNTPKFNQVRGKGKIVTKNWVMDCHSKRKRLPWRRYALDRKDQGKDESEEEIYEEIEEINDLDNATEQSDDENRDIKNGSDTEDEIERINTLQQRKNNDESDTEDEIERIKATNAKIDSKEATCTNNSINCNNVPTSSKVDSVFDADTDEETDTPEIQMEYPQLPNFFETKVFYIDSNLNENERKKLMQYITACNGTISTSLTDSIHFIVTSEEYKSQLSDIPNESTTVNSDFVYECYNLEKIIPVAEYVIE